MDGCDRRHFARDLCQFHYDRWRRHGDPNIASIRPPGCWFCTGGFDERVPDGRPLCPTCIAVNDGLLRYLRAIADGTGAM
jgi:hypothetical protein